MKILKRDGREVDFDIDRIINAITKANLEAPESARISKNLILAIAEDVKTNCEVMQQTPSVEDIQDMVEVYLIRYGAVMVSRGYIRYRYKREAARNVKSTFFDAIGEKLRAENVQNQNANLDERSFSGRMGEATDIMTKEYALDYLVSPKAKYNHINNIIYEHDLNSFAVGMHNCLSIPFDDLLAKGFKTRQTDVRPANSINTAMQLTAVIFQLQSLQQFGGCSATHIDWTMVPYVRKSFLKHYIVAYLKQKPAFVGLDLMSMMFDNYEEEVGNGLVITRNRFEDWVDENKEKFFCESGLTKEDFRLDNKENLDPTLYQCALFDTIKETMQAVEGMYHNLNTLQSRSGGQLPFTSINYGTCTIEEGRLVTKALLQTSLKGLGALHKTSIFPCGIFQCMKGVNRKPGEPNYDLYKTAIQSTAKRLYPNYANCDVPMQREWVEYDRQIKRSVIDSLSEKDYQLLIQRIEENPVLKELLMLDVVNKKIVIRQTQMPIEIMSTMGCRTQNGADINARYDYELNIKSVIKEGEIKSDILSAAQKDGRGNVCPVTIILPTVAMIAKEEAEKNNLNVVEEFLKLLDTKIHEAKDELIERFDWICSQDASSARFMYENNTMAGYIPEEGIRSALRHGTLAIGSLAINETLQILIGKNHLTNEGMDLAKRIMGLFKQRCAEFKEEYQLNFGVYLTPAENLCYTAMKKFKEKYGEIPNISDREFFTNSIHVPVWEEVDPFEKIDVESQLTGYSSAGCITYVELDGSCLHNIEALESMVNYAMDKDIPYFAINVPNDMCQECGYTGELNDVCPMCGSKNIQRLRRVTGYLTGDYKTAFNKGKQQEVEMRVKHSNNIPNWKK